ncbi:lysozyme inhibitor LprI family protein [Acinetobacter sp. MD2]|uniref:lysozyme inhibitor LprI family protein n=1 Tax=Acinetobacter sp. MD2 TaxID=2600066 RepID=UPI002D1E7C9B|nr:lysozyme inhibitor LprI family protein [Acinetobacter sp. MD2]MEB3767182.1 DUF1311 domain-containing protein [Acinetobacter sp. MD2]
MKKVLIASCLTAMSSWAMADNCDKTRNVYDSVYCSDKIYASADADLNKNYQLLRSKLNTQQKTILKRSQVAWIKARDSQCSDEGEKTVYVECNLHRTQERNHWLQERLRECKTIGCKTSALN